MAATTTRTDVSESTDFNLLWPQEEERLIMDSYSTSGGVSAHASTCSDYMIDFNLSWPQQLQEEETLLCDDPAKGDCCPASMTSALEEEEEILSAKDDDWLVNFWSALQQEQEKLLKDNNPANDDDVFLPSTAAALHEEELFKEAMLLPNSTDYDRAKKHWPADNYNMVSSTQQEEDVATHDDEPENDWLADMLLSTQQEEDEEIINDVPTLLSPPQEEEMFINDNPDLLQNQCTPQPEEMLIKVDFFEIAAMFAKDDQELMAKEEVDYCKEAPPLMLPNSSRDDDPVAAKDDPEEEYVLTADPPENGWMNMLLQDEEEELMLPPPPNNVDPNYLLQSHCTPQPEEMLVDWFEIAAMFAKDDQQLMAKKELDYCTSPKFRPTDVEVIRNLKQEYCHSFTRKDLISDLDVYDYQPHQLRGLSKDHGDGKMYFFTRVKRSGENYRDRGIKSKKGYRWKATQIAKAISDGNKTVGYKRPLKYWEGDLKTSWLMNEYALHPSEVPTNTGATKAKEELVVAVIYETKRKKKTNL